MQAARAYIQKKGPVSRSIAAAFSIFALSLFLEPSASAQSRESKLPLPDTLSEVQIKGIRGSSRSSSPTPLQTLSGRQLEKMNSLSVADALRYFSGVQVKDYGGIGGLKTINVRSLGGHHTSVFYDGIQVGNAQNGEVDLGRFSLDNMEELDLYNAQNSSIYQSARAFAASSSLFLQSARPSFKDGQKDKLRLTFRTGSFGLANPSLQWQHQISKRISSSLSSEWVKANGRYKFRYTNSVYDTTATRQNGDTEALRLEGTLYGTLSDSSKWTFKVFHYQNERGLPRAIVSNNFQSGDRQWDRSLFIQSNWQSRQREKYQWMLNAKYANDYLRYIQPQFDNIEGKLDNRYRQQEYYLSAAGLYRLASFWDVSAAADILVNSMSSNIDRFAYPTRYSKLLSLASELHTGAFRLQGTLLASLIAEKTKEYSAAESRTEFSPTVTASWQPFHDNLLLLRAFYKNTFRMPTFTDLYYTQVGSTALRPEFAKQYDAGFTLQKSFSSDFLQYVSLRSDAYINRITDKIVATPDNNIARWKMTNFGKVKIKGVEASVTTIAKAGRTILNTVLNYTFQDATDVTRASDFNYGHQIPYTPRHSASAIIGLQRNNSWINYSYIYTGERYSQKANIAENYMEPWYTHDLSVSTRLQRKHTDFKITAELNNVFNQYRDVVLNFPMPGRSYRLSLTVNY